MLYKNFIIYSEMYYFFNNINYPRNHTSLISNYNIKKIKLFLEFNETMPRVLT